jgi:PAS domain S-box-containing protein
MIDQGVILESISDGVFTIDTSWKITSFNKAAEIITGIPREKAIGSRCSDIFQSSLCGEHCALKETLQHQKPIINRGCYFQNTAGRKIPITLSTAVLKDESGNIIGGAETFRDLSELEELKKRLKKTPVSVNLESRAPSMRSVTELIQVVGPTEATVLICGETGTGKEVAARSIHNIRSSSRPFVAVNCGALPDNLLESELFGHKKGAFTGAIQDKEGLFSRASDGTLFLDEIGDISPALQSRLLRVLQEKEFEPLGSSEVRKTRARVIAATNKNLRNLVEDGHFREDLYYRLNVIKLELPPLKKRKEDIPQLAEMFIQQFNTKYGLKIPGISLDALTMIQAYCWPGNIRELQNTIERAVIVCGGRQIDLSHFPPEIMGAPGTANDCTDNLYANRENSEKQKIQEALKLSPTKQAAADRLGIHKTTLFKKIRKYGL